MNNLDPQENVVSTDVGFRLDWRLAYCGVRLYRKLPGSSSGARYSLSLAQVPRSGLALEACGATAQCLVSLAQPEDGEEKPQAPRSHDSTQGRPLPYPVPPPLAVTSNEITP